MQDYVTMPVNPTYHEIGYSKHYAVWLDSKSDRYRDYRRKWTENPKNFINEGYPINLDIEASSACNLRCPMCPRTVMNYNRVGETIPSKHFDFELYKRIIDEAADIGVYAIKLNWQGEPLMNPRIVDMVGYAKEKGIEDVIMNTNATLLTDEMSHGLIKAGIDKIFFSFDAPDKETYEKIRVGAKFDEVLANIKRFHAIRKDLNCLGPATRASMVMLPGNETLLESYKALFREITDIVAYEDYIDFEKDYDILDGRMDLRFACPHLWQRMIIGVEGEIGVCCYDHKASFTVGNIKDTTIAAVWNSHKYDELRFHHQNFLWHQIEICSRCPLALFKSSGTA